MDTRKGKVMAEKYQGPNRREEQWHLDKKVPISLIFAIVIQTVTITWFFADLSHRVEVNAKAIVEQDISRRRMWDQIKDQERIIGGLDTKIAAIDERTSGIKDSVDRLLTLFLKDREK